MASIYEQIHVAAAAADIWDAARDVGRLHDRLVPGFVVGTKMLAKEDPPVRRVTFADGAVVDEMIVSIDDCRRRVVWTVMSFDHHNGALTVEEVPGGACITWTADVLPHSLAAQIQPLMAEGLRLMKCHFEAAAMQS